MLVVKTISGSVYEIKDNSIRRKEGDTDAPRVEGGWKPYVGLIGPEIGSPMWITWPDTVPLLEGSAPGSIPMTRTSLVVSVEEL